MAAPVLAARVAPSGTHLFDGFPSKVSFSLLPGIDVWEKSVTPFGIDGREPVDQTTMWNQIYTTVAPRRLRTVTPLTMTCTYDPLTWGELNNILNRVQSVSHFWSDGSTMTLWAFVQKVELAELKEGSQPEMTITVVPAMLDPNAVQGLPTEQNPVIAAVAGTGGYSLSSGEIPAAPTYQS